MTIHRISEHLLVLSSGPTLGYIIIEVVGSFTLPLPFLQLSEGGYYNRLWARCENQVSQSFTRVCYPHYYNIIIADFQKKIAPPLLHAA
jgi:hypothetical protein